MAAAPFRTPLGIGELAKDIDDRGVKLGTHGTAVRDACYAVDLTQPAAGGRLHSGVTVALASGLDSVGFPSAPVRRTWARPWGMG